MAAEIRKITKDGNIVYPATVTDAIVHPELQSTLSEVIDEYNVSMIWPTGGTDHTNKYTLGLAISRLNNSLKDEVKVAGLMVKYLDEYGEIQQFSYNGENFNSLDSWQSCGPAKVKELEERIDTLEHQNVFLTLEEYESLVEPEKDKLYFIYEDE